MITINGLWQMCLKQKASHVIATLGVAVCLALVATLFWEYVVFGLLIIAGMFAVCVALTLFAFILVGTMTIMTKYILDPMMDFWNRFQ